MGNIRAVKRLDDTTLREGDRVVVPVLQDGEGRNVIRAARLREDPVLGNEPSFRIPTCERKLLRKITREIGNVFSGTVESLVPTSRIMYRPGPHEVIEVALTDIRNVPVERTFAHFRYRNCLVETETVTYRDPVDGTPREIARFHRSFTLRQGNLPERYLQSLPELAMEEYLALGRRVDWKLPREEAKPERLALPIPAMA